MRERLLQQLDAARAQHPVVWIAAPAGAGKTTLVASYLQHREVNALWYQVDSGDQDIASFFYYFGLAAKHSGARKKLPLFTAEYQLGLPAFTRNWFRALFAQRSAPTVLVLDNYQEAGETAALHTVLQHAADELPAGVNLMVISRAQPPAELTRLSAANAIATLGWDHLQLTADESAALVQTLTADASTPTPIGTDALQRLHQRTQGWITGVVLGVRRGILTAVDDEPPSPTLDTFADRTHLFDYFAAEVLARTDQSTRYDLFERAHPQFSASDDVPGLYLCWIGAATALFFRHDDMSPAPGWIKELEQLRTRHPKWPSLELQGRVTTTAVGLLTMGDPQNPALSEWVGRAEKIYRYVPFGAVRCFVGHQLGMYYSLAPQSSPNAFIATPIRATRWN